MNSLLIPNKFGMPRTGAKPTDNNQLIPRRYLRKLQQLLKVDADAVVARTTAARWASFAKAGDPNYEVGR